MAASDAGLTDGFHEFEPDNAIRWTNGDAALPTGLFDSFIGPVEVALCLGGTNRYVEECRVPRAA